jgi:hypothetical protein
MIFIEDSSIVKKVANHTLQKENGSWKRLEAHYMKQRRKGLGLKVQVVRNFSFLIT